MSSLKISQNIPLPLILLNIVLEKSIVILNKIKEMQI